MLLVREMIIFTLDWRGECEGGGRREGADTLENKYNYFCERILRIKMAKIFVKPPYTDANSTRNGFIIRGQVRLLVVHELVWNFHSLLCTNVVLVLFTYTNVINRVVYISGGHFRIQVTAAPSSAPPWERC